MQTISKWKITVFFGGQTMIFLIHDNHYSNMMRKLNEVDFYGIPTKIIIELDLGLNLNQANQENQANQAKSETIKFYSGENK